MSKCHTNDQGVLGGLKDNILNPIKVDNEVAANETLISKRPATENNRPRTCHRQDKMHTYLHNSNKLRKHPLCYYNSKVAYI